MIKQEEPVCLSQEGQIEEQRRQAEKQQATRDIIMVKDDRVMGFREGANFVLSSGL